MSNLKIFQQLANLLLPQRRKKLRQEQVNAQVNALIKDMQRKSPNKLICNCRGLLPGQPSRCR